MTKLSEQSHDKTLYACDNNNCHVITFTAAAKANKKDHCPGCDQIGLPLRGPLPADPRRGGSAPVGSDGP